MADKEYGVGDVARALKIKEPTARIKLRDHKIKKKGKSYSFTKPELDKVVKKLAA